jgi:hypothetical protein
MEIDISHIGGATRIRIVRVQPSGKLGHRKINNRIWVDFLNRAICCMY